MSSNDQPTIRDVVESDVPFFYKFQSDPDAAAMAMFAPRDLDAVEQRWRVIMADDQITAQTIVVGGKVAGCVMAWTAEAGHREIGYWLGRQFWGRGLATASVAEFIAVDRHRPLEARVPLANLGSARVLEKNGFAYQGEADGYKVFRLDAEHARIGQALAAGRIVVPAPSRPVASPTEN
jgi:RimJ/RimL family protein N-acetyltransferase